MDKVRVARLSVASNIVLVVAKLAVGFAIQSVAVIAEAIHSGIDLLAAVIAYYSVNEASKPADERHPYGHGKIENVSGTIEAMLIFIAAGWILFEAVTKLTRHSRVESTGPGILVMAVSALVNLYVSNRLMRAAKETESVALEADALHLRTDVYTSAGVMVGLGLVKFTGYQFFDPAVAILVAIMIIRAAFELTRNSFLPLLDASLPGDEQEKIREVLQRFSHRYVEVHMVRTRRAGADRHIDLHLVLPRILTIAEAHALCDEIEAALGEALPNSQILIHIEPCDARENGECGSGCDQCPFTGRLDQGTPEPGPIEED